MLLQCYHSYSHYFGVNFDFIGSSPQESCRQLEEAASQLTPVCVESSIILWNPLLKRSRIYKTQKEKKTKWIIDMWRVSLFGDMSIIQRLWTDLKKSGTRVRSSLPGTVRYGWGKNAKFQAFWDRVFCILRAFVTGEGHFWRVDCLLLCVLDAFARRESLCVNLPWANWLWIVFILVTSSCLTMSVNDEEGPIKDPLKYLSTCLPRYFSGNGKRKWRTPVGNYEKNLVDAIINIKYNCTLSCKA